MNQVHEDDRFVGYVTASSFPEGIRAAFEMSDAKIASLPKRQYMGLYWPDSLGKIQYRAGVVLESSEVAHDFGLEPVRL